MSTAPESREKMEFDIVIIGGGPAGLSASIRLMQNAAKAGCTLSIALLEKGSEIGAHILSGAVIDPVGLDALFPDWRAEDAPLKTKVTKDQFLVLGRSGSITLPNFLLPPLMKNHGNYIGSLGNICRWLAARAENLGVEIFTGFAGAEPVYDKNDRLVGVATGDMGIGQDGQPGPNFEPGVELHGKYILLAEGARGSLTKQLISKYNLHEGSQAPKFGLGLKEIWRIKPEKHQAGLVQHSFGWPLDNRTGGGSFLYHFDDHQLAVGFVVHLDYQNPYLSPFEEFQRFKTHPGIQELFDGAERLAYGARVISEGGWQSIPQTSFPGGVIIGCAAGLVNVPRIKGTHNAMLSGILAADEISSLFAPDQEADQNADQKAGQTEDAGAGAGAGAKSSWKNPPDILENYDRKLREGAVGRDLHKVRNVKPFWSRFGTFIGISLAGFDMWCIEIFGRSLFGTLSHGRADAEALKPAAQCKPIIYPKPDGKVTFDRAASLYLSGTNHEADQPVHLRIVDMGRQHESELEIFSGPSQRYCPAGVYEWDQSEDGEPAYRINAQNCLHCKTCDIKDPNRNISWTVPQGGGGPNYPNM